MDKQLLFRKSILVGTVVVSLGLNGCVLPQGTNNPEEIGQGQNMNIPGYDFNYGMQQGQPQNMNGGMN